MVDSIAQGTGQAAPAGAPGKGGARDVAEERREIDAAVAGQTVCSLFQQAVRSFSGLVAHRWKTGDAWSEMTWPDYGENVRDFANGLVSMGVNPGDFVNIISANRPEYLVADMAIMHSGATPVSLYNTLAPEQIEYIVNHCGAVLVIAENRAFYERLLKIRSQIPNVRSVIVIDPDDELAAEDWVTTWDQVLQAGREYAAANPDEFERRWKAIVPDDLCTLIYTSGTTGPPKGVMVTHANACWTAESLARAMFVDPGARTISYLPLAHIAERLAGEYLQVKLGFVASFCPAPTEIGKYLAEVKPEFFFAVPRIWEKLHAGLSAAIANNPDEGQRQTAQKAIEARLRKLRLEQARKPVPDDVEKAAREAEPVVQFIRSLVGLDQLKVVSAGAAPIATEVLEWFHAIGVEIAEVYGQSEDTGPTSWNRPGQVKIGTVGPTVPGVEVKLAEDGEILVRGGNVTKGYYKEPELTAETFDAEGWLHSGDVATIDDEGYIRIVDRKKEILITAGGKNIAPSNIESNLKQHPLIGQACVIGDRRPYVTALVVLDPEVAPQWAKGKGLEGDVAALSGSDEVRSEIQAYVDQMNTKLHNQEQVKKFTILPDEWTVDSGELTPTLKMKRKVVNERYGDVIESMYSK
ncbi:MAG TPA: long-chain fatty acid--CoA ligase [Actinomycetota bacterium]|nr:long-chain fatty acid--CoA ligase [Actinomycetota bacterium]